MLRDRLTLAALALMILVSGFAPRLLTTQAQSPSPSPTPAAAASPAPGSPANAMPATAPKVVGVEGNLELDDIIQVEVEHLNEWAMKNDASKIVPYMNGLAIKANYPLEI